MARAGLREPRAGNELPWCMLCHVDHITWGIDMLLSRRSLLAGAATLAAASSLPRLALATDNQKTLRLQTRQIEVGGKPATRYGVVQPSGAFGLTLDEGDELDVVVENALPGPSGLHWHGLTEPWRLDGVPYLSGPPIAPGAAVAYRFPAIPAGTRPSRAVAASENGAPIRGRRQSG